MSSLVMRFDDLGECHCLYSELIHLAAIGSLDIRRTSNIEFAQSKQEWEVRDLNSHLKFSHSSRAVCLDWEQNNLEP
jgi:hypothetical protein